MTQRKGELCLISFRLCCHACVYSMVRICFISMQEEEGPTKEKTQKNRSLYLLKPSHRAQSLDDLLIWCMEMVMLLHPALAFRLSGCQCFQLNEEAMHLASKQTFLIAYLVVVKLLIQTLCSLLRLSTSWNKFLSYGVTICGYLFCHISVAIIYDAPSIYMHNGHGKKKQFACSIFLIFLNIIVFLNCAKTCSQNIFMNFTVFKKRIHFIPSKVTTSMPGGVENATDWSRGKMVRSGFFCENKKKI